MNAPVRRRPARPQPGAVLVATLLLGCMACGGPQLRGPERSSSTFEGNPTDPLGLLPESTVGFLRFRPQAIRAHYEHHSDLWTTARCIGLQATECMYSKYFGSRKWPLLRDEHGDLALRLVRSLIREAFASASDEAADDGPALFTVPADTDWVLAVVLSAGSAEQLALWLPAPEPLPADTCLTHASFVRVIVPAPDGEALRHGLRSACERALGPAICEEEVEIRPAGERVIVDVGRANGCHDDLPASFADTLRGAPTHGLVTDPDNLFAAHVRMDRLDALHRAFIWQRLRDGMDRHSNAPDQGQAAVLDTVERLATLSDPRLQHRLLRSLTLRLRADRSGFGLDLVGAPTHAGHAVLEALSTSPSRGVLGASHGHELLDVRWGGDIAAVVDALRTQVAWDDKPLRFDPDLQDARPLSETRRWFRATGTAPAPRLLTARLLLGSLVADADAHFEALEGMARERGVEHSRPTGWRGLLPSSLTLRATPVKGHGGSPELRVALGFGDPSPLLLPPLERLLEDLGRVRATGPAMDPAERAAPGPSGEDSRGDDHELRGGAAAPREPEAFRTGVARGEGSLYALVSNAGELPEEVDPTDERPVGPGLHLVYRPSLHPAMADDVSESPASDGWIFGWLAADHWSTSLLHPGSWPAPHEPIEATMGIDGGLLIGRLSVGSHAPPDLPEAVVPAPEDEELPECWWRAQRWLEFVFERVHRAPPGDRVGLFGEAAAMLDEVADACPAERSDLAELIRDHGRAWTAWAESHFRPFQQ